MKLYSYWRSTTSYRVRIALHLKGIAYETVPINLVEDEQLSCRYRDINPVAGVPSLVLDNGTTLTQSMAIMDYLEQVYPEPALLPEDVVLAAQVKAAALVVACDIHPVNNLRVCAKLKLMGHGQNEVTDWMHDWMNRGLTAFQALAPKQTAFSFGNTPSLADLCLVPQLYNARRWGLDLNPFVRLTEIEERCMELPSLNAAHPESQPDAH